MSIEEIFSELQRSIYREHGILIACTDAQSLVDAVAERDHLKAENARLASKLEALEKAFSESNLTRLVTDRMDAQDELIRIKKLKLSPLSIATEFSRMYPDDKCRFFNCITFETEDFPSDLQGMLDTGRLSENGKKIFRQIADFVRGRTHF